MALWENLFELCGHFLVLVAQTSRSSMPWLLIMEPGHSEMGRSNLTSDSFLFAVQSHDKQCRHRRQAARKCQPRPHEVPFNVWNQYVIHNSHRYLFLDKISLIGLSISKIIICVPCMTGIIKQLDIATNGIVDRGADIKNMLPGREVWEQPNDATLNKKRGSIIRTLDCWPLLPHQWASLLETPLMRWWWWWWYGSVWCGQYDHGIRHIYTGHQQT